MLESADAILPIEGDVPSRIVILSDLHLGGPQAPEVSALRPLWADADEVIFNGDTAEVHHPDYWSHAARALLQLFDSCEADQTVPTFISGNHDPYLSDQRHAHLAGGDVFVTHGDAMHPAIAPWSPARHRLRRAHDAALSAVAEESRDNLETRLAACQHASFAEWNDPDEVRAETRRTSRLGLLLRPFLIARILRYWSIFPRLAAEFTARHAPDARIIVTGHSHRAGIWTVNGRTVINTGCFSFPSHPRAVVIESGTLSVFPIHRNGAIYELAPSALRVFDVGTDAHAPEELTPEPDCPGA